MEESHPVLDYKSREPKVRSYRVLVAVLIVLVALFLLLVLLTLVPVETGRVNAARHKATIAEISNLSVAVDEFKTDVGRYPTSAEGLEALVKSPAGVSGWHGPYIDGVPVDRWGHPYRYEAIDSENPPGFDVTSAGSDGEFGTADDIGKYIK